MKVVALAGSAKEPDLLRVGCARFPHAGTRREDLKGIGPQLSGGERRRFEGAACKSVDAEAQKLHHTETLQSTDQLVDRRFG